MISRYPGNLDNARVNSGFKPFNPPTILSLSSAICDSVWSPIIWRGGVRSKANFYQTNLLVLDFDNNGDSITSLEEAVYNIFPDYRHVIGTTRSHQKPKGNRLPQDRYRVILFFNRPIMDRYEYEYNLRQVSLKWDVDEQALDAARLFYPCTDIVSVNAIGFSYDVIPEPHKAIELRKLREDVNNKIAKSYSQLNKLSPKINYYLSKKGQTGERNKTIYMLSCELIKHYPYDYPTIENIVMNSETYKRNVNDSGFCREVVSTIKSAMKRYRG